MILALFHHILQIPAGIAAILNPTLWYNEIQALYLMHTKYIHKCTHEEKVLFIHLEVCTSIILNVVI